MRDRVVSTSSVVIDPSLPFDDRFCCDAQRGIPTTMWWGMRSRTRVHPVPRQPRGARQVARRQARAAGGALMMAPERINREAPSALTVRLSTAGERRARLGV